MHRSTAYRRYAQHYSEPALPNPPDGGSGWQHVLVIPAYRECPGLLNRLHNLPAATGRVLVILVLNRPDSDPDTLANEPLRRASEEVQRRAPGLFQLNANADLYLCDMERLLGPAPAAQGVGLARKYGCDLALNWIARGAIASQWIHSSDCDALLPTDYFHRTQGLRAVAATYPFVHAAGGDAIADSATALYELRLHYYVMGLAFAGSPYTFHTLGSCLAVTAEAYAQVRGFPKRAGGEDFYLLNKLAKVGTIAALRGRSIHLQSRFSARVPFGTGPAVQRIAASSAPRDLPLFYEPACFESLRALLCSVDALATTPLVELLQAQLPEASLANDTAEQLEAMGLPGALAHCRRQSRSQQQFRRQFHQWFDGFRTLKFIHGLRDRGRAELSLNTLLQQPPLFLPMTDGSGEVTAILEDIRVRRGWY